ncbi:hypothetical protein V5E97_02670 [Singulisphaera sp. Ch08]|uniref:DUF2330 domain-containing protein n=1 Tax=Singulisphaera sp. Ch08 TaxID=3120278 RepID=A0AAU7CI70_9BACT
MQPRLGRWPLAAVVALAGLLPANGWGAPKRPPIEVENLRVGFTTGTSNNLFKVGSWTPVWVQLKAGDQRFTGSMELVVPDDNDTPTTVHQAIDLGPGESQRFTTYTRPGTVDPDFDIRLSDPNQKLRMPRIAGTSLAKFDAIHADETLVLTLGKPQGVDLIPTLPGFSVDQSTPDRGTVIARLDAAGGYLPGRWYGYDAARAVVLDTNDRAVMASLDALRGRALVDWVRRGGHLVLAVGANWQAVRDSVLTPILPALPTGQQRINDLGAIESFASGSTKPIAPSGAAVMVAKLEEIEERGGKVLSRAVGAPLVVRGSHGFGRVTLIALDVDQKPFSSWEDRGLFWVRAIGLRRMNVDTSTSNAVVMGGTGRIYQSGVHDLSTKLRESLEQFQGVKLISFGWVAFFIFLYILLIGPGDYLFLKKVVKRMELTWITFPLIVVTVSLLAYYAAYVVKGNVLRVNKVDIVDVIQGPGPENAVPASGLIRGSTYLDIFSPQNRDYNASVIPLPLDRDSPASPDDAPARLPVGTDVTLSWFGVPEAGFGGMGNRTQMSFSSGGYEYLPAGGAEKLEGVRIPIWSTKCLTARWFGPGPATPLIESDLRPAGPDRLEGAVTNRVGVALHDAILAYNRQIYLLGEVEPGATVRVALSQDRQLSGHIRDKINNYLPKQPFYDNNNGASINRPDLLLGLMFHEAVAASATESAMASNTLNYLDLTGLLQLDRPMLVARIDRASSRLALENAPSTPQVDQTTMLRVILPLNTTGPKK